MSWKPRVFLTFLVLNLLSFSFTGTDLTPTLTLTL